MSPFDRQCPMVSDGDRGMGCGEVLFTKFKMCSNIPTRGLIVRGKVRRKCSLNG